MKILEATYKTSAVKKEQLLKSGLNEYAFVGRSNVGKSSLINALTNQKKLAKTSQTPGLTKMVNYFLINNSFYFVDLPGYGFSKTGKANKDLWARIIEDYLLNSKDLKLVFVLVDIRHTPTELDTQMLKYLYYYNIPFKIIATKSDKVPKSKIINYLSVIAKELKVGIKNIIPFSSENKNGKNEILEIIDNFQELKEEENE